MANPVVFAANTVATSPWWDSYVNAANWVGLAISVLGFALTLISLNKTRNAAEAAKHAADATLESIGKLDAIAALSLAIRTLSELPEMHRNNVWILTPRQLRDVSSSLVGIRSANSLLSEIDQTAIQSVITQIKTLVETAESKIIDPTTDTTLVGRIVDEQALSLGEILSRIRHKSG